MKTHAEFLEELKEYIADQIAYRNGYLPGYVYHRADGALVANDILKKIEQFEAQLSKESGAGQ